MLIEIQLRDSMDNYWIAKEIKGNEEACVFGFVGNGF